MGKYQMGIHGFGSHVSKATIQSDKVKDDKRKHDVTRMRKNSTSTYQVVQQRSESFAKYFLHLHQKTDPPICTDMHCYF